MIDATHTANEIANLATDMEHEIVTLRSEVSRLTVMLEEYVRLDRLGLVGYDKPQQEVPDARCEALALVSEEPALIDTVKERIADPKIVDVDLEDLLDDDSASEEPDPFQCEAEHHVNMKLTEWNKCPECGQRFEDMGF